MTIEITEQEKALLLKAINAYAACDWMSEGRVAMLDNLYDKIDEQE